MIIFLTGLCLPPRINLFISFLAATELKMNPISTSDLLHIVRTDFNILPLKVPRIVPVFSSFRAILYIYLAMRIYFWARKSSFFKQLSTKYNKLHNISNSLKITLVPTIYRIYLIPFIQHFCDQIIIQEFNNSTFVFKPGSQLQKLLLFNLLLESLTQCLKVLQNFKLNSMVYSLLKQIFRGHCLLQKNLFIK